MSRCIGCGVILQTKNKNDLGYIPNDKYNKTNLCERCFRILHYNDLKLVDLPKNQDVLDTINQKGKFAFFMCDLLNINTEIIESYKKINISKCLIISKVDFIPKYIKKENIKNWLKEEYDIKEEIVFISVIKNQNTQIISSIMEEKNINEAYLVGYTNSGKSSLINKLNSESSITTSLAPNTTIDFIKINLQNNLTIIDSPGILYQDTIYDENDILFIKKTNLKTFIKPLTYQLKKGASIIIEGVLRIENTSDKFNLTIYMSNLLEIKKVYEKNNQLKNLERVNLKIKRNQDLVIKGLGFITSKSSASLNIYLKNKNLLEIRNSFFER